MSDETVAGTRKLRSSVSRRVTPSDATAAELEDAVLREHNHFKAELTQRAAVRSLARALAGTP